MTEQDHAPTRRVIFMRHAKSEWSAAPDGLRETIETTDGVLLRASPALAPERKADHARPLNRRGRLGATLMGAWLAEQPWRVDAALISSSRRTVETWTRVSRMLDAPPEAEAFDALFHADAETLMGAVRKLDDAVRTVLVIAHNPGVEDAAARMTPRGDRAAGRFATATIAVFNTGARLAPWPSLGFGVWALEAYDSPKTLV